jgi:hypothetical protein
MWFVDAVWFAPHPLPSSLSAFSSSSSLQQCGLLMLFGLRLTHPCPPSLLLLVCQQTTNAGESALHRRCLVCASPILVHLLFFFLFVNKPPTQVKAHCIGKLLCISGTVIRASGIKPRVTQMSFRCARCGASMPRVLEDGKLRTVLQTSLHGLWCLARHIVFVRFFLFLLS